MTVDHPAAKAKLGNSAAEFQCAERGIEGGNGGESLEPIGVAIDREAKAVVGFCRHRQRGVSFEQLASWLVQRQDLHVDPGRIHIRQSDVAEILQRRSGFHAGDDFTVVSVMRARRGIDRQHEMLFQRDDLQGRILV